MATRRALVSVEDISRTILILRRQRVILDRELAAIYGVTTGRLNEAVKRNAERFPEDFMFRVSPSEHSALISQIATSNAGRGGHRKPPFAFTEHGAILSAIRQLMNPPSPKRRGIGFTANIDEKS
jgi:ORF6N domain